MQSILLYRVNIKIKKAKQMNLKFC